MRVPRELIFIHYSTPFQGIPDIAGTEEVYMFMVFHDIPYYSKAFQRPLRVPRELKFRWCSTIFHAIPRHSIDPCGYRGSWYPRFSIVFPDIPWYSILKSSIPRTNPDYIWKSLILWSNPDYIWKSSILRPNPDYIWKSAATGPMRLSLQCVAASR